MTTTKATSIWPIQGLTRQQIVNNAPANADIPRTLAGNAATLWGHTVGGEWLDDYTPNPAPPAPGTGVPGHDHSGGLFGAPLRRTVAHFDLGSGHEGEAETDVDGNEDDAPLRFSFESISASTIIDEFPSTLRIAMWVPHGDEGPSGAYGMQGVRIFAFLDTSTNTASGDELTLTVRNETTGAQVDVSDATITGASSYVIAQSTGTGDLLKMKPGALNVIRVSRIRLETVSGGSARTVAGLVSSLEIGVWLA